LDLPTEEPLTRYIQISASIQPGNSGGPVLDEAGRLVGVIEGKLDALK
jgi:serine protease Do